MEDAQGLGKHNVAFLGHFLLGRLSECIDLLVEAGRIPEAAFFARTYMPSRISEVSSAPLDAASATTTHLTLSLKYRQLGKTCGAAEAQSRD